MASYTVAIHDIITNNAKGKSLRNLDNLYDIGSEYVFGFSSNIISEEYRRSLITGFILHYMWDEIGLETITAFQMSLAEKLYNNKDFIELIMSNLDKQIYDTFKVRIKDDTLRKTDHSTLSGSGTRENESGATRETESQSAGNNTETLNTKQERTDDTNRRLSGSDSSTREGTDAVASNGENESSSYMTNGVETSQTSTGANDGTSTQNSTSETNGSNDYSDTTHTTSETDANQKDGPASTVQRDVRFWDNLAYEDTQTTSGQKVNEHEFVNRTRNSDTIDTSRARTINQFADTPQAGIVGSDVIGSSSGNVLGGGSSATGSKFLTNVTISDTESAGSDNHKLHQSVSDNGSEFDRESYNNFQVTHTHRPMFDPIDTEGNSNTQHTTTIDTFSQEKITTAEIENTGQNVGTSHNNVENESESSLETHNTNTLTSNGASQSTGETSGNSSFSSLSNRTTELTDTTNYGRIEDVDNETEIKNTGTVNNASNANSTVNESGNSTFEESTTTNAETNRNINDVGHEDEKVFTMSYETFLSATSFMDKIWNIFDDLFLGVF